jgi:hypothetical protein
MPRDIERAMRAAMLDYGALWRFPPSALLAAYRERVRQMALRVRMVRA